MGRALRRAGSAGVPAVGSFYIALTDWRIAGDPNWIGLDNFHRILTADRLFRTSLGVTAYYSLGSVPLRLLAAFTLAVLLNQRVRGLPVFRTIFYLPSIVPLIASSVLWIWLFNPDFGLLNTILSPRMGSPGCSGPAAIGCSGSCCPP